MELLPRTGISAEDIVMDKNSCLYGTSILVRETKGVKEFELEPLGKIQEAGRSGVWFFHYVWLQSLTYSGGDAV